MNLRCGGIFNTLSTIVGSGTADIVRLHNGQVRRTNVHLRRHLRQNSCSHGKALLIWTFFRQQMMHSSVVLLVLLDDDDDGGGDIFWNQLIKIHHVTNQFQSLFCKKKKKQQKQYIRQRRARKYNTIVTQICHSLFRILITLTLQKLRYIRKNLNAYIPFSVWWIVCGNRMRCLSAIM